MRHKIQNLPRHKAGLSRRPATPTCLANKAGKAGKASKAGSKYYKSLARNNNDTGN